MDLKDFVSATLVSIHEGVSDAITKHTQSGTLGGISVAFKKGDKVDWSSRVTAVEFDIAVTTSEKTSGTAKAGVRILAVADLGGEGAKSFEKEGANRIKFSVPILLPSQVFTDDS